MSYVKPDWPFFKCILRLSYKEEYDGNGMPTNFSMLGSVGITLHLRV